MTAPVPTRAPEPGDHVRHTDGTIGTVQRIYKPGDLTTLIAVRAGDVEVWITNSTRRYTSQSIFWDRWALLTAEEIATLNLNEEAEET